MSYKIYTNAFVDAAYVSDKRRWWICQTVVNTGTDPNAIGIIKSDKLDTGLIKLLYLTGIQQWIIYDLNKASIEETRRTITFNTTNKK